MGRLAIITDPTLAPGFRMAGVEVYTARNPEEAKRWILMLSSEEDVGVVALNPDFLGELDRATRQRVEESLRPVFVALPAGAAARPEERRSRQIAELIRRAIGFRISFRGEEASNE